MMCPYFVLMQLFAFYVAQVASHSEYLPALQHQLARSQKVASQFQGLSKSSSVKSESDFFQNIQQLTTDGTNAEAYWSYDDSKLVFQAIRSPLNETHPCDQVYTISSTGKNIKLASTGEGRDTCSYFLPDGHTIIYSSTSSGSSFCPPTPDFGYGYFWPVYADMDIYKRDLRTGAIEQMTKRHGYDAEATISPDGQTIVFTSDMDGDLELYSMSVDGSNLRRLTYTPGYDGGAFFSNDGTKIVWRANRPIGPDYTDYLNLLRFGLVQPLYMQLYIANADGTNAQRLTYNNATNFAPFFLPDDSGVLFSTDLLAPNSGSFQLFKINLDGTGLTQVTTNGTFNCFPMFSHNGKKLAWISDRGVPPSQYGVINIYTADWKS